MEPSPATLRIRLYCSFLRARLRFACTIGSLLLTLFLHNAVRFLALTLPFSFCHVAIGAATLAVPVTNRLPMGCSFLGARLRLARSIGSLLLSLFLDNAVRQLPFALPLRYNAISAAT